jgi:toxin FitB
MIILDTSVVSEVLRPIPDDGVLAWLDSLSANEVSITAITAAELSYGVRRMPQGRRRIEWSEVTRDIITSDFHDRVEPFDVRAADEYAEVVVQRERRGQPISKSDAQIAAICRVHDAVLATRNIADFTATGVQLINPWKLPDS